MIIISFIFLLVMILLVIPSFILSTYTDAIFDNVMKFEEIPNDGTISGENEYKREVARRVNRFFKVKRTIEADEEKLYAGMNVQAEAEETSDVDFDRSDAIDIKAETIEIDKQSAAIQPAVPTVQMNWNETFNQPSTVEENTWKKIEAMKARIEQLQQQLNNNKNYGSISN